MLGSVLIDRVRRNLRDIATPTEQGEFWSDAEIYLALNNAQLSYASFLLRSEQKHYVGGLLTSTGITAGGNLPFDYMTYSSAYIQNAPNQVYFKKIAKIYTGGEAWAYRFTKDTACWIIGSDYGFIDATNYDTALGELNYYRYPTTIATGTFIDDFTFEQYTDTICHVASIMLAMKEPQTQRDFKRNVALTNDVSTTFVYEDIVYYVVNNDVSQFYKRYISNARREAAMSREPEQ